MLAAKLPQPSTPRRPARASSSCVTSAHVSLGSGVNRPSKRGRRLRMQTSSVAAADKFFIRGHMNLAIRSPVPGLPLCPDEIVQAVACAMAPTLAKSQKPRPELTRRRLALRFHAASERTTACCQPLCSQQTAVSSLPNCCSPSKQRRKLRRVDQVTASARDCRRAKLWAPTVAAAPSSRLNRCGLGLNSGPTLAQSRYSRRPLAGLSSSARDRLRSPSARNRSSLAQ